MKAIYFEGTSEEVMSALKDLTRTDTQVRKSAALLEELAEDHTQNEGADYVSYDIAKTILERKPLNASHRTLLRVLAKAYPDYVSSPKLMKKLDLSSAQFRGFMGAFGRRISYTDGWEEGGEGEFFDQHWDDEAACVQYRLAETSLEAVKDLGLDQ